MRPKSAFRRLLLPTLLLPKKATSGKGEGGKERKKAALKRTCGSPLWKKEAAYCSCCAFGGTEIVYECTVAGVMLRSSDVEGLAGGGRGGEGPF